MNAIVPPTAADVRAAARRIAPHTVRTPLLGSPELDARLGGRVLVKAEMLQRTGSFKARGAFNCVGAIPEAIRGRGVIAYSSGNHAQGVAHAAAVLGAPATIVMPSDAPAIKLANTRAYGAEVVLYDRARESREEIGGRLAAERGATLIKPYDDPLIVAGQGTVGLEIAEQAAALGVRPDAVLVPCGGGGLSSGSAIALRAAFPEIDVVIVEPAGLDDTARSLREGRRVANPPEARSICDGLLLPTPGELPFAILRALAPAARAVAVPDAASLAAMEVYRSALGLVAEPSGAATLGALLAGLYAARGRTVVVVASGGNVDPPMFLKALGGGAAA